MSCLKNIASTCTWEQYNILISIMSCEGFTEQQEIVYILTATNYIKVLSLYKKLECKNIFTK